MAGCPGILEKRSDSDRDIVSGAAFDTFATEVAYVVAVHPGYALEHWTPGPPFIAEIAILSFMVSADLTVFRPQFHRGKHGVNTYQTPYRADIPAKSSSFKSHTDSDCHGRNPEQ
jgi:hypothetical protein